MAAPTNTVVPAGVAGNREDLTNLISRVAPEQTPFTSNIKRGSVKVKATRHEWQTEDLATPNADNAQVDGDETTTFERNERPRVGNLLQTVKRAVVVSGVQERIAKAGGSAGVNSELARQKLVKGIECRRDVEARAIGNYASNEESGTTPRRFGGALAWLTTNTDRGVGGADGGYSGSLVTAATDGTQRTFEIGQMDSVIQSGFENGATFSMAFMSAKHKGEFAAFSGRATNRYDVTGRDEGVVVGGADVYMSNHGKIVVVPVQYGLTRDVLLIDPSMWCMGTLGDYKYEPLNKTGDNTKGHILADKTLVCKNEKGGGAIADLT